MKASTVAEENANNNDCSRALNNSLIRLFDVPTLNLEANAYHDLVNFEQNPTAITSLTDTEIEDGLKKTLILHYQYDIANLCSGTSNLLRKRRQKLQDLIDEMSHSTKN